MADLVLDFDLVARPRLRAGATRYGIPGALLRLRRNRTPSIACAKLRCSGRRKPCGDFSLSCHTRTPTGSGPPVTALAASSGVHCGPQPGKRRASLALCRPDTWSTSFTVRGRGLVQHLLTQVLRCLFTPTRRLGCAKTAVVAPPSPQKGALTRPANITRGDYAHWPRGTLPTVGAPCPESGLRPHNPRYVSCPRQRTYVRCKVWLRHVVVPPPALVVRPKRLALRCSFPLWPAAHPSAPKGLPRSKDQRKNQKGPVPCQPERRCACLPGSG